MAISAQDVQASYAAAGLPPPTAEDIQYWTQTYAQTPDVVYSPNPQQQVVNAILAAAPDVYDLGQFNYLTGGADLGGTTGINIPQMTTQTVNLPTTTTGGATVNLPAGFQGATRDQIVDLYRSIGLPNPSDADINWWMNFSRTNPDVLNASNPMTQLTNAFRAASTHGLTPAGLPTTGESRIDPAIAPYLTEALGVARNLFLQGPGPQMYPGQMYVSPSAQTLQALQQAETLATSPQAQGLGQQGLQAYGTALGGLQSMAAGDYLQSPEYQRYLESVTRPVTEQITQQILPSIASQYSAAGRYGSGAMTEATGRATELGTRALGDVTSQVAQQQQGRMLEAQQAIPTFLGQLPSVMQGALAPSTALAGVGAQREAIAGQPLQEAIRRFEYGQQLPYSQLSGYLSSIYGSPLGNLAQPQQQQGNTALQNIGGVLSTAAAIPSAVRGVQTLGSLFF